MPDFKAVCGMGFIEKLMVRECHERSEQSTDSHPFNSGDIIICAMVVAMGVWLVM